MEEKEFQGNLEANTLQASNGEIASQNTNNEVKTQRMYTQEEYQNGIDKAIAKQKARFERLTEELRGEDKKETVKSSNSDEIQELKHEIKNMKERTIIEKLRGIARIL